MDAIVVGIDVSKDRLDVAVRPTGETFAVERDAEGLSRLIARLAPLEPQAIAVEATGGYETVVAASLSAAGLPVVVVNPAQVRAFAKALGKRAKTDPIDAAVIAHFVEAAKPDIRPMPDEKTRLLADLVARRAQIVQMIVAERQRQKRLTEKRLQKSIARLLAALQKELSSLETDIDEAVRGSPAWREKEDLLASVPGVGPTIARTLIAELPELGRLDRRKIAALVGSPPDAPVRTVERQKLHRRREDASARRPLHGRSGRRPPQFRAQGLPSAPPRRRKTKAGRNRRRRPKAPHHPQRDHPRAKAMAPRLTAKTVAPPKARPTDGRPSGALWWGRTEEGGRAVLRDKRAI